MQHITWPRGVICHSFISSIFLSFLSLHLPLFPSPPFHFYLFASFSLSFLHFLPSKRSHCCFNGSAPVSASLLSAKITGSRTSKWRCIPGSWKGMCKAKRAGLEGAEDWDMQEGLKAGKTWDRSIDAGKVKSSPPAAADRSISSISIWNGQSNKNIFHNHKDKNK